MTLVVQPILYPTKGPKPPLGSNTHAIFAEHDTPRSSPEHQVFWEEAVSARLPAWLVPGDSPENQCFVDSKRIIF